MKKLILIMLAVILSFTSIAQLEVTIGAGKTELKNAALTIGITYVRSFDSLFVGKRIFVPGKKSFLSITPEAEILTGTEDAFSSIVLKAAGHLTTFRTTTVAGLVTPDFNRTFHIFPMSIGIESNNLFNNVNGIAEIGWVPYYQSYGRPSPDWLKKTNIGFFLQAGYKFNTDTAGAGAIGGEKDESLEQFDKGILRAKGNFNINTGELAQINGLKIGLVGSATGWYDIINSAVYHKIDARARFFLNATQYIDFIYSKGSGAPLFNLADQYGVGLTLRW